MFVDFVGHLNLKPPYYVTVKVWFSKLFDPTARNLHPNLFYMYNCNFSFDQCIIQQVSSSEFLKKLKINELLYKS